jgi:hypothetical protein
MGPVFTDSHFTRQAFSCYKTCVIFIKTHIKTLFWVFFPPMKSDFPRIKIHAYFKPWWKLHTQTVTFLRKETFFYARSKRDRAICQDIW